MDPEGSHNVKTMAAKEAKQSFGKLLDDAQREPVRIERNGRLVAVVLSSAEYERLSTYRAYLRRQATEGQEALDVTVAELLSEEERREAEEELEAELLKGLRSGPATPLTRADWADIDRKLQEHIARRHADAV
jgi:prevent-host-death family protein